MTAWRWSALILLVFVAACSHSAAPPDLASPRDLAMIPRDIDPPVDLAAADLFQLGPCAFQPNRGTCASDWDCGGEKGSCKLGKCCSAAETIDPVTCKCHCNGGPECADTSQFCCLQGKGWDPDEPDTLKCRDEPMCSPMNHGP